MEKGYLVLQDGRVFEGVRFGANTQAVGELVFQTGAGGFIEVITDPAYAGQILMQTYPLVGNYGIIHDDEEGEAKIGSGRESAFWEEFGTGEYADTNRNGGRQGRRGWWVYVKNGNVHRVKKRLDQRC